MATTPQTELAFLEIEARLRTMTTAAGRHFYSLTDSSQVIVGEGLPKGVKIPTVSIAMTGIDTEDGHPLGEYRRRATFPLLGIVPGASGKPRDKFLAGIRFASDIDRVILTLRADGTTLDRSLNGTVYDVRTSLDAMLGDDFGYPGAVMVQGTVDCYWEQERGL